jgi:hypothetical protein
MTATTKTRKAKATPTVAPVVELGADLSPALKAMEAAWRMIRKTFPDTPDATIVIKRDDRAWGHTTVAKVWAPASAAADTDAKATRFEIMISGENLRRGADAVAGTLLHEAAHARNLNSGVLDTDSNGRHNRKFATTAESHGLTVTERGWHGWATTELSTEGRKTWRRMCGVIATGLAKSAATANPDASHLGIDLTGGKVTPGGNIKPVTGIGGTPVAPPRRGNRNLTKATCPCGFSIRASVGVLTKAAPTCGVCGEAFTP